MRFVQTIQVRIGDLLPSEFREFLGPIDEEDCLALKEDSLDRYNDFWMGLRVYEHNGYHLVFGHRRIRAMILKNGLGFELPAKVMEYTDEEKVQLLGEAGWRNSTEDERIGLVKLASAFLIEYGEGFSGQVDIDLLKERTGNGSRYEGSSRISNWLGKRLWPQQRISDLLKRWKTTEVLSEGVELLQGEKHEDFKTAVEPAISPDSPGYLSLEADPNAPINPKSVITEEKKAELDAFNKEQTENMRDLGALRHEFGSAGTQMIERPKQEPKEKRLLDPGEQFDRLLTARQNGIEKDFKTIPTQDLRKSYKGALLEFVGALNA